jgi:hypothetical protein
VQLLDTTVSARTGPASWASAFTPG